MRVAYVTPYPSPYRFPVWRSLGRRCDLTVWAYTMGTRTYPWSLQVPAELDLRVARAAAFYPPHWDQPLHVLQGWRPPAGTDVVVIYQWSLPASWQLLRWAERHDVPVVLDWDSTVRDHAHRRGLVAAARRRFVARSSAYVVPGREAAEAIARAGADEDRIFVADLVPGPALFSPTPHRATTGPGHRFVFVGRLVGLKNVDLAIRAFGDIRRDDDELWIVGDGPDRAALEALAAPHGDAVRFLGHLPPPAVAEVFAEAHTCVLPSRREVWGMAVAEALASGLHVVVSDRAGIVESVQADPGVFPTRPDLASVAAAMTASRDAWHGPVVDPPMTARTPDAAAAGYLAACRAAVERAR